MLLKHFYGRKENSKESLSSEKVIIIFPKAITCVTIKLKKNLILSHSSDFIFKELSNVGCKPEIFKSKPCLIEKTFRIFFIF